MYFYSVVRLRLGEVIPKKEYRSWQLFEIPTWKSLHRSRLRMRHQYSLETSFYTSIFESHPRYPHRRPFNRIPGPLYIRTHLFRWHLQPLSPKSRDHGRRRQQWRADATPERLEAVLGRSHRALAYAGHWYSPRELVAVYAHDYKWKKVCIHVL